MAILNINEGKTLSGILITTTFRHIIKGLASKVWQFYLGSLIDSVGTYQTAIIRSMISCCVHASELGKVYALLSSIESLIPLVIVQGYVSIFQVRKYIFYKAQSYDLYI